MLKIILIIVIIMIYLGIGTGISLFINCDTDYWTKDEFNESFNEFALGGIILACYKHWTCGIRYNQSNI